MERHHIAIIDVADYITVAQNDIFLLGIRQKPHAGFQGLNPAVVDQGLMAERGKHEQARAFAGQIPSLSGAKVIHQGLIIALCDNTDLVNARIDQI